MNREAELDRPSRVACSDLLGRICECNRNDVHNRLNPLCMSFLWVVRGRTNPGESQHSEANNCDP
jgi:hypothetical protein